jgi:hypothetical protein
VLPDLGGKIVSLRRIDSPKEFLLSPPERAYQKAWTGALFEDFDTSGFDECFPSVAPDHGVLWSIPWSCEPSASGDALEMRALLPDSAPWSFERILTLRGTAMRLEYRVTSRVDRPENFLWSAHPLLAVSPGSRIILPEEVEEVLVEYSATGRFERGEEIPWEGLDRIRGPGEGTAEKLFTGRLRTGVCALHDAASNESIVFHFDPHQVPFVGLWICQGGWPTTRAAKHFTVALEPCSGRPDALADAVARGEHDVLPARGERRWWLEVELRAGAAEVG